MSTAELTALREADPASWLRAAQAWQTLADDLDRARDDLDQGARGLVEGWSAGLGAAAARQSIDAQASSVAGAVVPARRVASALEHHAYALASLRALASADLGEAEQTELLARSRALDVATGAALYASSPPASVEGTEGGVGYGADRAAVEAQRSRTPEQVRAWWASLTPSQRATALRDDADILGWLDGLPAADRDVANRSQLAGGIDALSTQAADLQRRIVRASLGLPPPLTPPILMPAVIPLVQQLADVRSRLAGLQAVRDALAGFGDGALLLGVDAGTGTGRDGRVVVAVGDPDHARHTAVFVPGMNTDLRDTAGDVARVATLARAADALTQAAGDVAGVYWLGYDAPDTLDSLSYGPARAGGAQLVPFVDGLRAAHDPGTDHITLVGHSYGSTVVAEAALAGALHADDIVAAGSPGMHTDHAADMHLDPRHVWGGVASGDPVGGSLGELPFVHGDEPTDPAFGANQFVVDTQGHSSYWSPGSASLHNQAAIVAGRYDLVGLVHGAAPGDQLVHR